MSTTGRRSDILKKEKPVFKCACCGKEATTPRTCFYRNTNSKFYKSNDGYFTICKDCTLSWYQTLVKELNTEEDALRLFCEAFDIYYNPKVVEFAKQSEKNTCAIYLSKINIVPHTGKTFIDTLREETEQYVLSRKAEEDEKRSALIDEVSRLKDELQKYKEKEAADTQEQKDMNEIDPEIVKLWGPGYTADEYNSMTYEYTSWLMGVNNGEEPDFRMQQGLIQLCKINTDIARARSSGAYSPVSSLYKQYSDTLKKYGLSIETEEESTFSERGLGTLIKMWEETKPVPEAPPDLRDVGKLWKYISIWFTGHLSRMYGLKNKFTKMYEDEISKYKVMPEDDEDIYFDIDVATMGDDDSSANDSDEQKEGR